MYVKLRWLLASLSLGFPASAVAQVSASFFLEKTTFARGEPVFLYFSRVNNGQAAVEVTAGDADQPFCSGVSIYVSNDFFSASCGSLRDSACQLDGPLRARQLLPGQAYVVRFLLNFRHDLRAAGNYWADVSYLGNSDQTEAKQTRLTFSMDMRPVAFHKWRYWRKQLRSPDLEKRQEAAKTLASLAPRSLERTLLGFANSPEFRTYAPLAFHRLNTRRSTEALARFMSGPATNEQIEAVRYLAETKDPRWYPLLRDAAEKNAHISHYPAYAADLGGSKMLPLLVALADGSNAAAARQNAVMAMGSTRSRTAIPFLLEYLKSRDVSLRDRAGYALQLLTHRTAREGPTNQDRESEYAQWSRWWEREGATAPLYGTGDCGERLPLP